MFRFSRTKLLGRVPYQEFMAVAKDIARLVRSELSGATVEVLTYERFQTAEKYPRAVVMADSVMAGGGKATYDLDAFTSTIWENAQEVQLTIRDASGETSFMICVSCRPGLRPGIMDFYGQSLSEGLFKKIYDAYTRPAFLVQVSNDNRLRQSLVGDVA